MALPAFLSTSNNRQSSSFSIIDSDNFMTPSFFFPPPPIFFFPPRFRPLPPPPLLLLPVSSFLFPSLGFSGDRTPPLAAQSCVSISQILRRQRGEERAGYGPDIRHGGPRGGHGSESTARQMVRQPRKVRCRRKLFFASPFTFSDFCFASKPSSASASTPTSYFEIDLLPLPL